MPVQDYPFQRYSFYDRKDVATVLASSYPFQSQRGSWGISGIVRFTEDANYVFFVSFGQKQAAHEFDEAVYSNGIVRWQSQPAQKLTTPMIQQLIQHDYLRNDILLFLRTRTNGPYTFLGFLKYISHDRDREQPVHFHGQILEFDATKDYDSLIGLRLDPAAGSPAAVDESEHKNVGQTLVATAEPFARMTHQLLLQRNGSSNRVQPRTEAVPEGVSSNPVNSSPRCGSFEHPHYVGVGPRQTADLNGGCKDEVLRIGESRLLSPTPENRQHFVC